MNVTKRPVENTENVLEITESELKKIEAETCESLINNVYGIVFLDKESIQAITTMAADYAKILNKKLFGGNN